MPQKALSVPVEFGQLSIGESVANLGVKIDREKLTLANADANLCNSRCNVVIATEDDVDRNQKTFDGMDPPPPPEPLESVVDIKGYRVTVTDIASSMVFQRQEIDVSKLAGFAKAKGTMKLKRISDIPKDEKGTDDDE